MPPILDNGFARVVVLEPVKSQVVPIFRVEMKTVKHGLNVSHEGYLALTETQENSKKAVVLVRALKKLVLERDILFGLDRTRRPINPISALRVTEENVILCFTVLRDLDGTEKAFRNDITEAMREIDFKETVIASKGASAGADFFGPTFRNLALVVSSVAGVAD